MILKMAIFFSKQRFSDLMSYAEFCSFLAIFRQEFSGMMS